MNNDTDAVEQVTRAVAERMEKELFAAWRAGYDYVHVYNGLDCRGVRMGTFSVTQYVLPSNTEQRPEPPTASYQYTYDLTDIPGAAMREAWRTGEIPDGFDHE